MPLNLILASASPRRVELLRTLGKEFQVIPSATAELHDPSIPVTSLCEINAKRKAAFVARNNPASLIIGADTLVALGNQIFGKPSNLVEARNMLFTLQGRTHQVVTAVSILCTDRQINRNFYVTTQVAFKRLTPEGIHDYVQKVHVLDKAGAYAIQEFGSLIIESISGSYSNVVGLPMERLAEELMSLEVLIK